MTNESIPSLGVEEEYQLVDPATGALIPNCESILNDAQQKVAAQIHTELHQSQIEMASEVCDTLADVRRSLSQVRSVLHASAKSHNTLLVAAGTNPLGVPEAVTVTLSRRYEQLVDKFQELARRLLIFGCHVHVSMPNKSLGLQVMNGARRWLPLLQAITANSPFWDSRDTGYVSYRRELWLQWPMAGAPPWLEDIGEYEQQVNSLVQCGAIPDASFLYWDIRLPTKLPTIEFRCADVLTELEDAIAYAGLVRAIVMRLSDDLERGISPKKQNDQVLRYAMWSAARFGVAGELVDPETADSVSGREYVAALQAYVASALEQSGDITEVEAFLQRAIDTGTGAQRQRDDLRKFADAGQEPSDANRPWAQLVNSLAERTSQS